MATTKATAAIAILAALMGGCTSLTPIEVPPQAVREQVRAGQICRPGERVFVTTEDGETHEFKVVEVTELAVRGSTSDVLIDQIVSVRTKQTNPARTVLAVVGAVGVVYIVAALDAMDSIIDDVLGE